MFKQEPKIDDLSNDQFAFYLRFCLHWSYLTKNEVQPWLDLILGEELLPFSVVSTTFTICELKYGREKRIKIHYKEKGKTNEILQLNFRTLFQVLTPNGQKKHREKEPDYSVSTKGQVRSKGSGVASTTFFYTYGRIIGYDK